MEKILDWTIKTALEWTCNHFNKRGEENPRLVAQYLLCHATGLSRLELYLDYLKPLTTAERTVLREAIKRRDNNEPLQYILGEAAFRRLLLKINPGVLIPRPETETLVDLILPYIESSSRILEIGTGSGCIAISLVVESDGSAVVATDLSDAAIALAAANAMVAIPNEADRQRLILQKDNFADSLVANRKMHAQFAIIVSNPPYIPTAALADLPAEIREYEPLLALDGGEDGLTCFHQILNQSCYLLESGGLLALELHSDTLAKARDLAKDKGMQEVTMHQDLTGRERFLTARKP
jgi:release factor glutamine methyltransferase